MSCRIALLGLSGAGKSTLIAKVRESVPLLHLQASALIKAEQAHRERCPDSSETLRTGAVIDNQALMIAAFRREAEATTLPIVFDGHSVIDGRDGLVEIPAFVFASLGLDAICYLVADPQSIVERRQEDLARERPARDVKTLEAHQIFAQAVAQRIASEIACSFAIIADGAADHLIDLVS
ncbi:ATP-binding protein [Bosea sp. 2RAB26]|uniref:ATP-binding protein n=1 Tax=Bosea sp. 2RAB26 TaxID=3237476 RepID=UPI003F8F3954